MEITYEINKLHTHTHTWWITVDWVHFYSPALTFAGTCWNLSPCGNVTHGLNDYHPDYVGGEIRSALCSVPVWFIPSEERPNQKRSNWSPKMCLINCVWSLRGKKRGMKISVHVRYVHEWYEHTCPLYTACTQQGGQQDRKRCSFIDILISRPCGDGNARHSLNCMD